MNLFDLSLLDGVWSWSPEVLAYLADALGSVAAGITIIAIGVYASGKLSSLIGRRLRKIKRFDRTLVPIFSSLIRYAVLVVAIVAGLGSFGIETTSIIAILGAAGLAIGLALQGTLANVAAGVMLLFLRPFKIGDWVETGQVSGMIEEIGLFRCTIETFDRVFISVPNSAIWGDTIINHSHYDTRRMDIDIGVAYDTDLKHAEAVMLALTRDDRVMTDPPPKFLVTSYGDSAIMVRLRLYARADSYWGLYEYLMRGLKPALDKANISIPFPQREIRMHPTHATHA